MMDDPIKVLLLLLLLLILLLLLYKDKKLTAQIKKTFKRPCQGGSCIACVNFKITRVGL